MNNYTHIQRIGKGSFGIVSKIRRNSDGKILVWKEVNYGCLNEKEKQLIVTEVNLLRELRHPNIVRYLDRVIDKVSTKIYIVMEYCQGGDLSQYIKYHKTQGVRIEEKFIWKVFSHVFLALKECHRHKDGNDTKPILHRDIKPGNIFLDSERNAKLGDFGLAKEMNEVKFAMTNVGTPYYMSPEMVNEMQYDERSDIWALGCLLYEMAALAPPFDAKNHLTLAKKIVAGKFERIPNVYSDDLFQAIRWMLHRQRSKRPRVEDLEKIPKLSALLGHNTINTSMNDKQSYLSKLQELKLYEQKLDKRASELSLRETNATDMEKQLEQRKLLLDKKELLLDSQLKLAQRESYNISGKTEPRSSPTESTRTASPTTYYSSGKSSEESPVASHSPGVRLAYFDSPSNQYLVDRENIRHFNSTVEKARRFSNVSLRSTSSKDSYQSPLSTRWKY